MDFTHTHELGITIGGELYNRLRCEFALLNP